MSQQGQAENLHNEGRQRFEEARRKYTELEAKQKSGELSGEALTAAFKEWNAAVDDAQTYLDRAKRLNLVDRGIKHFAPKTDTPEYLRPAWTEGDATPEGGKYEALARQIAEGSGLTELQRQSVARISGGTAADARIATGNLRRMLNAHLRDRMPSVPEAHKLSAEQKEFLRSPAEFLAKHGVNVEALAGLNPYIDRDGGAVTAEEVRTEVIAKVRDRTHIRNRARVISTRAAQVTFPSMESVVGLKTIRSHKGKVDGSGPRRVRDILGKTTFTPSGEGEIIKVPEQLVMDTSFDLIGFITDEIALQAYEDEEGKFLSGTGAGEPYGVLNAPIQSVNVTGSGGADITPEDIKLMPYSIREVFRSKGAWMGNREFYRRVSVMRTEDGGANTGQFLFEPGLKAGDGPTLVGDPTLESEFFPDYFSSGSTDDPLALYADWEQYWIVDGKGLDVRILDQLYAEQWEVGYRFTKFIDGAPVRLEAFSALTRKS